MNTNARFTIRAMRPLDWRAVAEIYREGIATGHATFAAAPPASWEEWCATKIILCSIVACFDDEIVGWAVLSPVSARKVYVGVAEISLYVGASARGCGVGAKLLSALIERSESEGMWTLQAGIFPENEASLRLHLKHGFREVGKRERLGKMTHGPLQGQWRDVILLERRSRVVGIS